MDSIVFIVSFIFLLTLCHTIIQIMYFFTTRYNTILSFFFLWIVRGALVDPVNNFPFHSIFVLYILGVTVYGKRDILIKLLHRRGWLSNFKIFALGNIMKKKQSRILLHKQGAGDETPTYLSEIGVLSYLCIILRIRDVECVKHIPKVWDIPEFVFIKIFCLKLA